MGSHFTSGRYAMAGERGAVLLCVLLGLGIEARGTIEGGRGYNIIHVVVDDLRNELGAYGLKGRHTPNLDGLAAVGTTFDRAYAQQAVCGPSRNSFMSGRRPDRSLSYNFINHFREAHPDWTTIPGLFLGDSEARVALGSGKMYHPKIPPAYDSNRSWSPEALPYNNPCWNTADDPHAKFQDGGLPCIPCPVEVIGRLMPKKYHIDVETEICEIDAYEDTFTISKAVEFLKKSVRGRHFYLGVGLHKPHLPWQASADDFAKHDLNDVRPAVHQFPPSGVPGLALHMTDGALHTSPWDPMTNETQRKARRAYRAAITGMDRKLGVLLDLLPELGLENNTAILVHSDHGWNLGEMGLWRKFTNFELATRVPLIIKVPGLSRGQVEKRVTVPVELVDILPTVADLAGIPLPEDQIFDGKSLVPLLTSKSTHVASRSRWVAFSQYPRDVRNESLPWNHNGIIHTDRTKFTHMGYTLRTEEWRYTEWVLWNGSLLAPVWSRVVAQELYDHRNETIYPTDLDATCETANVVAQYPSIARNLSSVLHAQFDPTL